MPNHNTTILDISGTDEEVAAWFARHVLRVESKGSVSSTIRDQFDFETVIPRPASIKATSRPDGTALHRRPARGAVRTGLRA
jgi:hypothetical protein